MSEWKKVKLGDYIDVLSGFAYKSKDFSDSGIPVIKIKNVCPPYISLEDLSYVPNSIAFQNPRYILRKGDVLIAMTGSHINQIASVVGRVGRVRYDAITVLNQRVGKIVNKNEAKSSLDYIYYYLSQYEVKVELAQKAGGAANQANISPSDIKNLLFPYPPIEIQHRIATILSRYDSLIENYQKQIKLLEEAAQRLYKEWFVDLHFPGHENVIIVDGVPEGWEKKKISDVCDTIGGGTPSTKVASFYEGGTISWVTPTDITKNNSLCLLNTEKKITNEGLNHSSAKMVPKGAILMTSRASVGFFGICDFEVCTNQGFISCVPFEKDFQMYLLYNLINRVEEIRIKAGGSTYLEISKSVFRNFDIICPAPNVSKRFQRKAHSLLERTRIIAKQIRLLTEARDRLLPKLMSGEIAV
ncbi:restriction endonuclease subunit S [Xylanibacter brevis]|uniref:restriction endonuclease subunit S n=1 Tax=Xylanibacter brevis TaxID=83231 RepID=UPI000693FB55|nr:restriction endonuclease subunit S [Xylanibacter brevis]